MSTINAGPLAQETPPSIDAPPAGRWVVVSLPEHVIGVFEDGAQIRSIDQFSTGRQGHLTPLLSDARIDPARRFRVHFSTLYKDASGHPAAMPFALFFSGPVAFHGGNPNVESHGCVHLDLPEAEWLFNWVGRNDVHVRIIGPRPAEPGVVT